MNFREYLKKQKVVNQTRLAIAMGLDFPEEPPQETMPDLDLIID
jgi:hypothetical protein